MNTMYLLAYLLTYLITMITTTCRLNTDFTSCDSATFFVAGVTTGHFSQVVWKDGKEIGVGKAFSDDGRKVIVVCNYFPAGNVRGQYKDNVIPAK